MDSIPPKVPGIYKIFFHDPNLFYIGSTSNLQRRRRDHLRELRNGIHQNPHLQHAYAIYGSDAFHFETIEFVEHKENLLEREQYYLDMKPYYNVCAIAQVPPPQWNPSPERRKQLSEAMKGNTYAKGNIPPNKGGSMSDEAKAKMSAAKKGKPGVRTGAKLTEEQRMRMVGRKHSEESKEKNRIAHIGKTPPNKGKPMSLEQRQKLSEAHKGKPTWSKGKVRTPEHRANLSASLKGRSVWNKGLKGKQTAWNKGRKASPESIAKMNNTRLAKLAAKKATEQQASLWDDETGS